MGTHLHGSACPFAWVYRESPWKIVSRGRYLCARVPIIFLRSSRMYWRPLITSRKVVRKCEKRFPAGRSGIFMMVWRDYWVMQKLSIHRRKIVGNLVREISRRCKIFLLMFVTRYGRSEYIFRSFITQNYLRKRIKWMALLVIYENRRKMRTSMKYCDMSTYFLPLALSRAYETVLHKFESTINDITGTRT